MEPHHKTRPTGQSLALYAAESERLASLLDGQDRQELFYLLHQFSASMTQSPGDPGSGRDRGVLRAVLQRLLVEHNWPAQLTPMDQPASPAWQEWCSLGLFLGWVD